MLAMGAVFGAAHGPTLSEEEQTVERLVGRGVTLKQALTAYNAAVQAGAVKKSCTTAMFWKKFLKQHTAGQRLSYTSCLESDYSETNQDAQVHIVHSWSMKHCDTLLAAAQFLNELNHGPEPKAIKDLLDVSWHQSNNPKNLMVPMFICTYVVDQYSLERHPVGTPLCEIDKFHLIAKKIHEKYNNPMVIAADEDGTTFSRSYCLEEIHCAIQSGIPLRFCGTGSHEVEAVNAEVAEAYDKNVQETIRHRIASMDGGFDAFNNLVNNALGKVSAENFRKAKNCIGQALGPREMVVFLGNPGAGKSTLLNCLVGKVVFKSGVSFGSGLTTALNQQLVNGKYYVDTPGLADTEMKEMAAREIDKALQLDGDFHFFFVVVLIKGRVQAQDVATMKCILDAAPITRYSVIINDVKPQTANKLRTSSEDLDRIKTNLMVGLPTVTDRFIILDREDDLDDMTDALWKAPPQEFKDWIAGDEGIRVRSEIVDAIDVSDLSNLVRGYEDQLQKMITDKEFAETEVQRQRALNEELIRRHVKICAKPPPLSRSRSS